MPYSDELATRMVMIGIGLLTLVFWLLDYRNLLRLGRKRAWLWRGRIIILAIWTLNVTAMSITIVYWPTFPLLSFWRTLTRVHGQLMTLALAIELYATLKRGTYE